MVRLVGYLGSEKVTQFTWSPAGDVFAICEKEGLVSKQIWSFFMVELIEQTLPEQIQLSTLAKVGKRNAPQVIQMTNAMQAAEVKYEFRKTARHEITD